MESGLDCNFPKLVMPGILRRSSHRPDPVRKTEGAARKANRQQIAVEIYAMVSDAVTAALELNPAIAKTLQD
jgi:hypothetical protein